MAVASAKKNLERNLGSERNIQVIANNCLDGMKDNSS